MEVEVKERSQRKALIEFKGETFTITNLVREYLWEEQNVSESAQIREHPLLENPKIWIITRSGDPIVALKRAVQKIRKDLEDLKIEA